MNFVPGAGPVDDVPGEPLSTTMLLSLLGRFQWLSLLLRFLLFAARRFPSASACSTHCPASASVCIDPVSGQEKDFEHVFGLISAGVPLILETLLTRTVEKISKTEPQPQSQAQPQQPQPHQQHSVQAVVPS